MNKIFRTFGIDYNSYYYLINDINYPYQLQQWGAKSIPNVKELSLDDFRLGDPSYFTRQKLDLLQARLEKDTYKAYGVLEGERLVYSCFLSISDFVTSSTAVSGILAPDESLMIDAYCAPDARGKGFHGKMNAYRLMRSYELGKTKCIVIVLKENTPALKSQLAVGYKLNFKYYTLKIGDRVITNFYKMKDLYGSK